MKYSLSGAGKPSIDAKPAGEGCMAEERGEEEESSLYKAQTDSTEP